MALILKLPVGGMTNNLTYDNLSSISYTDLSVFCQTEEPENKEGIWVQSDTTLPVYYGDGTQWVKLEN